MGEIVPAKASTSHRLGPLRVLLLLAVLIASLGAACGISTTKVEPVPDPDPQPGRAAEPGSVQTPPPDAQVIEVSLNEWSVAPSRATVQAGLIYFLASNKGAEPHELVVIRTDLPHDQLPVDDGRVPEDDVDMIGEIEPFAPGSEASAVFDLTPGEYVLICNILEEEESGKVESHYQEGMHTAFTVQ